MSMHKVAQHIVDKGGLKGDNAAVGHTTCRESRTDRFVHLRVDSAYSLREGALDLGEHRRHHPLGRSIVGRDVGLTRKTISE
jgi:hypothetical protein